MSALHAAAENGDLDEVKKLIRDGAEIDKKKGIFGNISMFLVMGCLVALLARFALSHIN